MRAARGLALLLLLVLPLLPAAPATGEAHVAGLYIEVDGETAHGLVGVPAGAPTTLVVILHGYGHQAESHRGHLLHLAQQGHLAVAMDYRGPVAGFPLANGAADTKAAIETLRLAYPSVERMVLYSVSMGTGVAALLLPQMPGAFEYWVNHEGMSNLAETWAEARAVCPAVPLGCTASAYIEQEAGGTPATAPQAFRDRMAVARVAEFGAIRGVVLTHAPNDGLVPYNQGREMVAALRAEGIPSDFYTVVRGEPCQEGTTITGYLGLTCTGLAGHGTESNDAHTLTKLSFALLDDVLAGRLVPANREQVVDHDLGTLP